MDQKQQIDIIQQMLNRTRYKVHEGSIFYIFWGWLVLSATVIEFLLLTQLELEKLHWITWPVLMPLGGIITYFMGKKMGKEAGHITLLDSVMKYLWGGIVTGIIFSLLMSAKIGWSNSYLLVILFYAIGSYISGRILDFRPLVYGGLFSLLLVAASILFSDIINGFDQMLIVLAISIVGTYLIPGYLLRANKEEHV
jgi:hypothetical protein